MESMTAWKILSDKTNDIGNSFLETFPKQLRYDTGDDGTDRYLECSGYMRANCCQNACTKTISSKQWFSSSSPRQQHMEVFLKYIFLSLIPRVSDSVGLGMPPVQVLPEPLRVNGEKKLTLGWFFHDSASDWGKLCHHTGNVLFSSRLWLLCPYT